MSTDISLDPVAIIRKYHSKQVAHLKLKEAYDSLVWVINQEPENVEELYLLVGPSGCGKSTLLRRLEADIFNRYKVEMDKDPGMIPVIYVQLASPQDGNFNWKDFFSRLLEKFNDVLIKRKVILHPEALLNGEIISTIRFLVREELRRAVRNAFVHRNTKYLLLDEAGHMLITKTSIPARVQFEIIKSIAQELHIPIILAGDYTLLRILELNGQLTRRTEVIHFSSYSTREFSDPKNPYGMAFINCVFSLLEGMPIQKEDDLIEHIDYFFQNSLGTIGLLKKWFKRALWKALMSEQRILTREILESTRWSNKSLKLMITETKKGEAQLEDIADDEIARELGLKITPSLDVITKNFHSADDQEGTAAKKSNRGQKRPGTRGPSRDPVGGVPHAA
jgi:predicted AAA+ superfamily ATPase